MDGIVSAHEYELAAGVEGEELEAAFREADERGLFDIQGLDDYCLLRGIKGDRRAEYVALWFWESRAAWEDLWGPVDDPVEPDGYPDQWKTWEGELLEPLLATNPDDVGFTSYEVRRGAV